MCDLETTTQRPDGSQGCVTEPGQRGDQNTGAKFGTAEEATGGTDRDADAIGQSKNQGHGHPHEERGAG